MREEEGLPSKYFQNSYSRIVEVYAWVDVDVRQVGNRHVDVLIFSTEVI